MMFDVVRLKLSSMVYRRSMWMLLSLKRRRSLSMHDEMERALRHRASTRRIEQGAEWLNGEHAHR